MNIAAWVISLLIFAAMADLPRAAPRTIALALLVFFVITGLRFFFGRKYY